METPAAAAKRIDLPVVILLIGANLLPIAGVLWWGWQVREIVFLYWSENLLVGGFAVLRIIAANPEDGLQMMPAKLLMSAFFVFHYGAFCWFHGDFLVLFFPPEAWESKGPVAAAFRVLRTHAGQAALAAMVVSHAASFLRNYLGREENCGVDIGWLMIQPYKRIVVTHVFIIVGGFVLVKMQSPVASMVVFVALKIALDAGSHLYERASRRRTDVASG